MFELRRAAVELGGRQVIAPTDLAIAQGELVALVGPSGAGKTTLLRMLAGLQPVNTGSVHVHGTDLTGMGGQSLRNVRSRIGFVHQDFALVPNLRASQNILHGALGRRSLWGGLRDLLLPRRADLERAHQLLERLGIGARLFQRCDTLSGGEQQRVAIARALFQDPVALLADEPVASVDPVRGRDLIDLLSGLAAEHGLALVCSLHDLDLARACFPRMVALRDGKVRFDGPPKELAGSSYDEIYDLGAPGTAPVTGAGGASGEIRP